MTHSSTEDLLQATKQLVAIPSTAHDHAALRQALDFMAAMIWNAAPDVTIERFESNGIPSLLAYRAGQQRPANFHIMLNGHLDVVPGRPEQYNAVIKDGKLYGRGVYDMKAACVVMADVFCEYVNKVPYALGLQMVTDEENAGKDGTLHQIQQGVRADFVISGECGRAVDTYEIANEAKGLVIADIAFSGTAAHSAYPWKGDNAILKALRFVDVLHKRYPIPTVASNESLISVTAISADSGADSKLPDYATVTLAIRYVAGDPSFKNMRQFTALIKALDPEAKIVHVKDFTSPIYTSPDSPLLLALKASAERVEGAAFTFVRRHGTGDGRFYGAVGD
jgi:succinyl-diaminopimelate desuccinylase